MIEDHLLHCAACSAFVAEFVRKAAADGTDVLDRAKQAGASPVTRERFLSDCGPSIGR